MAKRLPGIREIYRGMRKPTAPPTRVERDRRDEIRGREDDKEIERHRGKLKRGDAGREEQGR